METEFRTRIQNLYQAIERSFEQVDPDAAECEQTLGSLVITLSDQSKCILSVQPSVRQLWLAIASRGTAYHFNFDPAKGCWIDDKGKGIELISFLEKYLKETTGIEIKI